MNALVSSVLLRLRAARVGRSFVEANAAADLAVSGRGAFERFRAILPTDARLVEAVRPRLTEPAPFGEPALRDVPARELAAAASATLDRAYTVAWALTGGPYHRARLRPELGWIAVSGEDDPPHSPVNIPVTGDHVGRWAVQVPGVRQRFSIRMAIKVFGGTPEYDEIPTTPIRILPPRGPQTFHDIVGRRRQKFYDELAVFIHGLGSRLEESEAFKQSLIAQARRRGLRLGVLSLDLPGFGYSDHLDLDALLRERTRGRHHGFALPDGAGSSFPVLTLYRDLLAELSRLMPGRIQYACGGSLGGNLTLCLAEEPSPTFTSLPLDRARGAFRRFASWSPASVWESYERARVVPGIGDRTFLDIAKNGTRIRPQRRMHEDESSDRRAGFFELMQRGEEIVGLRVKNGWGYPAKRDNVLTQSELYSAAYRRCFWATAYEQTVLSHAEKYGESRARFLGIDRPLLIAAGSLDTGGPSTASGRNRSTNIYDNVAFLTDNAPDVPGERHLMLDTAHSISDERPYRLAEIVAKFFAEGATLRQPEGLLVAPAVNGRHGADIWHMARDRANRNWSRSSPIAGHPLAASIDCDGGLGIPAKFAVVGDFDGDGRMEIAVAPDVDATRGNVPHPVPWTVGCTMPRTAGSGRAISDARRRG